MWIVKLTNCFNIWLSKQDNDTQEKVLASLRLLETYGPKLSRPYVDTVKNSQFPNMKELRIQHMGKPIRAFFAFDPQRQAIVLCAGCKTNNKKFYAEMIHSADKEFTLYLTLMEKHK